MDIARLILTTDFSDCSEHAFSPAAAIARRAGAEIDLVNVAGALPPFAFGHTGAATTLDAFHRESEARLAEVARRPVFDGLSVHCHVLDGFGPEAIDEFHDEVGQDLVVTATHGHAGLKRLVLGSFAERVVRLVKCPALVFRGDSEATDFAPRRILFSHDFSQLSAAALPRLRSLATEFDARIFALHVVNAELYPPSAFWVGTAVSDQAPPYWENAEERARDELEQIISAELSDFEAAPVVATGAPGHEIVASAIESDCDLILLSTHGHTGLTRTLLGSVAERVVREAKCSVMTVRPGD